MRGDTFADDRAPPHLRKHLGASHNRDCSAVTGPKAAQMGGAPMTEQESSGGARCMCWLADSLDVREQKHPYWKCPFDGGSMKPGGPRDGDKVLRAISQGRRCPSKELSDAPGRRRR
jgi:hypothetical protein